MDDCIFCKIARGEVSSKKIYWGDNFFVIPDANPLVEGHSLVISKKHFENILDLPSNLGLELLDTIKKSSMILMKKFDATGFNVVQNNFKSAGQIVKHVHFHLVPRKDDDGLKVFEK